MRSIPEDPRDHWPRHARQWALVGPPLRPSAEDVAVVEAEVATWSASSGRAPRALLLGVTPELATARWPDGTALVAVDRAAAMVGAVFPRAGVPAGATAMVGDWRAVPHDAGSFDVVLGDGCLSCLGFPAGYREVARELARLLDDRGRLILRLFAAPERGETLGEVAGALAAGRIGSLHALKWRIAMAVQPGDRNVRVVDILAGFDELVADRAALAARTGWSAAVIAAIDVYRDSELTYSFPTLAEVRDALGDVLVERACHVPGYELGDRCPTLVLERR